MMTMYRYHPVLLLSCLSSVHVWNTVMPVDAFSPLFSSYKRSEATTTPSFGTWMNAQQEDTDGNVLVPQSFDEIVLRRTACKKFQPYTCTTSSNNSSAQQPLTSNPTVVQQARHCLQLAQHAPSSFNTQPYKIILVHSPAQKQQLAKYALGPNQQRVLDADCTAVFCADRQVLCTLPKFLRWLNQQDLQTRNQPTPKKIQLQMAVYITLFSSGYPLPRILAAPISFLVRNILALVGCLARWLRIYVFPSLSSAETWTVKQCLLTAMTYMLGCSSRGLDTAPMEGINAAGIRRVLKIPKRYAIPLIIATGTRAKQTSKTTTTATPRYPTEDMIFDNQFGTTM
ncbi:Nitroreductase family [Seminavis robusta]|uniref:Nitroreductase family n=1 Tax=Seminavis robusta TaxID=568900 RepID=A0A9N8DGY4_9STRA|nr:Nitroreductase family [Seminavis robusta]|eukprot:Sro84_g044840.1 Nitroreductase family (341) ;mRNA; r:63550-64572